MDESIKTKKKGINTLATTFFRAPQRDERDYEKHMDYLHYNPVKHGLAEKVADWPHSTFHRYVRLGVYEMDWAGVVQGKESEYFGEP